MSFQTRLARKIANIVAGWSVLIVGVVMIPYPGPGWLVVFAGLAILAREYEWARRFLHFSRGKFVSWNVWIRRQNLFMRLLTVIATTLVVLVTMWLLNIYGMAAHLLNLQAK